MPGADGPPVGPGKRTESRFVSPKVALLRLLFVFSGSSRKGGAFRHQREPGWCCLHILPGDVNISNIAFILYVCLRVGELKVMSFLIRVPVAPRGLLVILVLVASR